MLKLVSAIGLGLCLGCGGAVGESRHDAAEGGQRAASGTLGFGAAGARANTSGGAWGGSGVRSTYVEPECPDIPVPVVNRECDPLGDSYECGLGQGCYPITQNPTAPCEPERFEMLCLPSGAGQQWDECSFLTDCSSGYTCVVTAEGTECLKMCDPLASSPCPRGLFCDGVDLQGIGICF